MTIKFNLGQLAQNLQKVGNNFLGNAVLLESSRGMQCGGFGGSIWGCNGGLGGGFSGNIWGFSGGMMGGCTPPLNIFHPMYSNNQYNPYLTEAGMANAEIYGRQMFEQVRAQQNESNNSYNTSTQPEIDTKQGEEFETAMKEDKEFKFVNEAWENAFNKEDKTDAEKKLINEAYNASATNAGKSYLAHLDSKHGNKDGEMSLDEYTDYLIETQLGKDATSEQKAEMRESAQRAFAILDLDNSKNIGYKEMSAVMAYLDTIAGEQRDGNINSISKKIFDEGLLSGEEGIKEELENSHKNLFGE